MSRLGLDSLPIVGYLRHRPCNNCGRWNETVAAINVVVTCTQRKKVAIPPENRVRRYKPTRDGGVDQWLKHLQRKAEAVEAKDLYCGEHWDTVRKLLEPSWAARCNVWVASAGYGLIPAAARVKPYGATFATGDADTVVDRRAPAESAAAWWRSLAKWRGPAPGRPRTLTALAKAEPKAPLIVAAAPPYLRAMMQDLVGAAEALDDADKLVIVTSRTAIPGILKNNVVVSDVRMRGKFGGSCVSLNARVLVNALESEPPARLRASILAPRYARLTNRLEKPMTEERKTITDDQVREFIRAELKANPNAKHSPLLRKLRTEKKLQCEQKRFRNLFLEVRG